MPTRVVDLGCGPGQLTASLAERWPTAYVQGLDTSPEMIEQAMAYAGDRVGFRVEDLRAWRPDTAVDVIISNETLQWVPEHRRLLPGLLDALTPGGWLAFQVPGNFERPSHRLLRELAGEPRYAADTAGSERPTASGPATYLADLSELGARVDAWETTYLHVLSGPDAVFRWVSGTGARPILASLPTKLRTEFENEYRARLDEAYPPQSYGSVLPFRRVFVVAQRANR